MPCYDSRDSPSYVRDECRREFRHNSDVAEMLCALMKQLEATGTVASLSPDLLIWWAEHMARDAAKERG